MGVGEVVDGSEDLEGPGGPLAPGAGITLKRKIYNFLKFRKQIFIVSPPDVCPSANI